ncbi:hypothetical protein [Spirosoma validum]|uniref:Uncharacterized protein n=1 Tax=Spirosoma validum TaxID=2771355 RepID=A0A927B5F8_9BACT|nr:hypothetical protein [Spirosoma validum]MBD2755582.1 hypothetical protein [Spirosoma validum]
MKKYVPYFILSLPLCAVDLLWRKIPAVVVIHTASSDQLLNKDDFGGMVVAITGIFALVSYGLLQLESLFHPINQSQLYKAYLLTCGGASLLGLTFLCLGLMSR